VLNDIKSLLSSSHGVGLLDVDLTSSVWARVRLAGRRGGGGRDGRTPLEFERERSGLSGPSHSDSVELPFKRNDYFI
jgi:hypothetical protein